MATSATTSSPNTSDELRARAPGKVILSGEHSVVYGAEALAVAVQQHTTVRFSPVTQSKVINTLFSGISTGVNYPLNALSKLKHKLDDRFDSFSNGDLPVQHILSHPNDLVMYALSALMHQLPSRKTFSPFLPDSGVLRTESTIPEGAGMGSSASAIAATLVLYEDVLDKHLSAEQRFDLVRFCERLQHGKGSAIDAATVTFGGANRVREHKREATSLTLDSNWYWLHTGTPSTSTGECVQFVRKHYAKDTARWAAFNDATQALETALTQADTDALSKAIKENHQLLKGIGVVPSITADVIDQIERLGGAAKISGAGAVAGEHSGLVLMYLPQCDITTAVEQLNTHHPHYIQQYGALEMDSNGARRIPS